MRKLDWKILVLIALLALPALYFSLAGDDAAPSIADTSSTKPSKTAQDHARTKATSNQAHAPLPNGATRLKEWEKTNEDERQILVNGSKSPNHFDSDVEWGYFDSDGNWVAVDSPGTLASDGYFYDAKGRRIIALKVARPNATEDQPQEKEEDTPSEEKEKHVHIYVVVKDLMNSPLSDCLVTLSKDEAVILSATSNKLGLATFPLLTEAQAGEIVIAINKPFYKAKLVSTKIEAGIGDYITIYAEPDWVLSGTILDENELPLEGARVEVLEHGSTRELPDQTTGVDGAFRFQDLLSNAYDIAIHRADYQSEFIHRHTLPGFPLRIVLRRSAYISGVVKDHKGNPLEHVRVESRHEPELQAPFVATTFTGADGSYKVDAVHGAERMKVIFTRAGYSKMETANVPAGMQDLNAVLIKNDDALVSGTLVYADGSYPRSSVTKIGNRSNSNEYQDGQPHRFEVSFRPREGESATLVVYSTEFARQEIDIGELAKGDIKDLGQITVVRGAMIEGIVLDEETGEPVADAKVYIGGSNQEIIAISDSKGRFTVKVELLSDVEDLDDGIALLANKEGYDSASTTPFNLPHSERVEIYLGVSSQQWAFVKCVEEEGEKPIAGLGLFTVYNPHEVFKTDASGNALVRVPFEIGAFNLDLVDPESAPFFVFASNSYVDFYHSEEEARENQHQLKFTKAALIRVAVKGEPERVDTSETIEFDGVSEQEFGTSGNYSLSLTQSGDGETDRTMQVVPIGTYHVSSDDLRLFPRIYEVPETKEYTYSITPTATITLRGVIRDAAGNPYANRGFYLFRSKHSGVFETLFTDSQGRYEVKNLWPGDFHFAIAKDNSEQAAQYFEKVTVQGGAQEQTIDISLPDASTTIKGVVKYADGTPVVGATVSMTDTSVTLGRGVLAGYVRTDVNGKFSATRIESHASILVRVGGYADAADTRLTFHEVSTEGSGTTQEIEIIVERLGASGKVAYSVPPTVVFQPQDITAIATDSQGRRVGNFFQGNFLDLAPGRYTYQFYAAGYLATPVTITVSEDLSVSISGKAQWSYDPDWPSPE